METPHLEGPQHGDLPDLSPHVDTTTLQALDAAPWRGTQHVQAHAYIVLQQAPDLYGQVQRLIREHGMPWRFRGSTYKYVRIGQYKYWMIPPVLNREPLVTPEGDRS